MVSAMTRRGMTRCLALVWAMLQLLSPGVSAIADGSLARESATSPLVHVEATGSEGCPEVHSPDCGVCRYLSTGGELSAMPEPAIGGDGAVVPVEARLASGSSALTILPHGRAPPAV